ncbi:MAG: RsiV family protein, partial [Rikenellaceae bacterium]
ANGYSNVCYLNFDNKTGKIIPIEDLIDFTPELLQEVRKKFCIVRDISLDTPASEATMFVAPAELPFPKEIGFSSQGVVFYYNLYEVGPRYAGDTEVVIPFDKVICHF